MSKSLLSILLVLSLLGNPLYAQESGDSLRREDRPAAASYTRLILPAALITYGVLAQLSPPLERLDKGIDEAMGKGHTKVDDYLQLAPAVAVYGLDFAGIKAKHSFRDRTFVMASSHLLMALSVYAVKHTAQVMRPDGSAPTSFPSGHTATAFTGAHILFREYKDVTPWIGIAGYAAGAATGLMRITNRKHWLSDVVAGAGAGILCAEAGYLLLPVFRRMLGEGGPDVAIAPILGGNTFGLGLAYRF
jgi:membrane-associated phospholipid phosphatase